MKSSQIKDTATREAVSSLENKLKKIQGIPQLPLNSDLASVIAVINKITDNLKR